LPYQSYKIVIKEETMGGDVRAARAGLAALICVIALACGVSGLCSLALAAPGGRAVAKAAKAVYLVENAHLTLASEEGSSLTDRGHATGTYSAPLTATFTIHPTSVTALVTLYPRGGSMSGRATANYVVQNSTGYFGGTLTITHGTGTYRHVSGKSVGFSGTIDRYNFAATVKAHGEISY
jgi:hypothetical protein